jgi:hypothetical protein
VPGSAGSRMVPASGSRVVPRARSSPPVVAAAPIPVIAPARVPKLTRAPLWEGPRLRVRIDGGPHPSGPQSGGRDENRCSYTWNSFHEGTFTQPSCDRICRRQRFLLPVSCQSELSANDLHVLATVAGSVRFDSWGTRTRFGPPELPYGSGPRSPGTARRRAGTHTSGVARAGTTARRRRARGAPR